MYLGKRHRPSGSGRGVVRHMVVAFLSVVLAFGAAVLPMSAAHAAAGSISGTVTGPAGTVSSIYVNVYRGTEWVRGTSVGTGGTYLVTGLAPGTYRLVFSDGNGELARGVLPDVAVTGGETTTGRDIILVTGGKVTGTVSGPAGFDLSHVDVIATTTEDPDSTVRTTAHADGTYTLSGVATGTYSLRFKEQNGELLTQTLPLVAVTVGQTTSGHHITLEAAGKVIGTVSGPVGVTLSSVRVAAFDENRDRAEFTFVGAQGSYTLSGLRAGTYQLEFTDIDGNLAKQTLPGVGVTAGQTTWAHEVTMVTAGTITGTVDSAGLDLAGVHVAVYDTKITQVSRTPVAADGSYSVGGLAPGTYHLQFGDGHGAFVPETLWAVDVSAGQTTSGHDVTLKPVVTDPAFENGNAPVIQGTAQVGVLLTASAGVWTPTPDAYAYQWIAGSSEISGATSASYTPVAEDEGKRISVRVTASGTEATAASATSEQTASVLPADGVPPVEFTNRVLPVITGTAKLEVALRASTGTWSPTPDAYAYQWLADGAPISGATAASYTPVARYWSKRISVRVTASGVGLESVFATSVQTAPVLKADVAPPTEIVNTAPPVVSGGAKVGVVLSTSWGSWTPTPSGYSFQWLRGNDEIAGATRPTYTPVADDVGQQLSVRVRVTGLGSTLASATSTRTLAVLPADVVVPPTTTSPVVVKNLTVPRVKGRARVKGTLKATAGTWAPASGIRYRYQWYAGSKKIRRATGTKLRLTTKLRGKKISVRVTATAPGATAVTVRSRATKKVKR